MKDQTHCPKCGRMYCEGFWGEGVCTADMHFGGEPTSDGDAVADYVRQWYERNRETWWDRYWRRGDNADEFMLGLINEVTRVLAERERQEKAEERTAT